MINPVKFAAQLTTTSRTLRATLGLGSLILLSACGGGAGGGEAAPVALGAALPDEGDFIAIVEKSISVAEAARTGSVQVARLGSAQGATSVSFNFVAGSADASTDYRGTDGVLNWSDGDTGNKTISFVVESDLDAESDEDFRIEISDINGQEALGINDSVSVTVQDSACSTSFPASISTNTSLAQTCYRLQTNAEVSSTAQLQVPAGTAIFADAGTAISLKAQSTLNMDGKPGLPIVVKSANGQGGSWNGFKLQSSSALHRVQHVEISGANNAFDFSSGGFALFDHNVMSNNTGAGIKMALHDADTLGANNQFLDTIRGIELKGTIIDGNQSVRLPAQSTHYVLSNGLINSGTLALDPGVDLRIAADAQILVLSTGAINAIGTIDQPISIRGLQASPGFWNGIQYVSSSSEHNQFEHARISHGGGDPARPGNIIVDGLNTSIAMKSCEITHSAGYGLVYDSGAFQVDLNDVSFDSNLLGDQSL